MLVNVQKTCRLCLAREGKDGECELSSLKPYIHILSGLGLFSLDDDLPQRICNNCIEQIEVTQQLRQRMTLTETLWARHKRKVATGVMLNCHVCGESIVYQNLRQHMLLSHGQIHLNNCSLCEAIDVYVPPHGTVPAKPVAAKPAASRKEEDIYEDESDEDLSDDPSEDLSPRVVVDKLNALPLSKPAETTRSTRSRIATSKEWPPSNSLASTRPIRKSVANRKPLKKDGINHSHPKPPCSYTALIMLAFKNCRWDYLHVSEIYKFAMEHFPYYRTAASVWKNSIRHALCENRQFKKVPGRIAGKRMAWSIDPTLYKKCMARMSNQINNQQAKMRLAMQHPENLEALERGDMIYKDTSPMNTDDEEEDRDMPHRPCGFLMLDDDDADNFVDVVGSHNRSRVDEADEPVMVWELEEDEEPPQ